MELNNLTVRPIIGRQELDLFGRLSYVLDHELADDLDNGRRRPEWMWVALHGDRLLARLAWWRHADQSLPRMLDFLDVDDDLAAPDRVAVGVRLLRTATRHVLPEGTRLPEYERFVPSDWRETPSARSVVETRMDILERTGAHLFVERLRLEWRPGTAIAEPTGRLLFRPIRDTEELLALMSRVVEGSLDAHDRDDLSKMSARDAATSHYDEELKRYRTPREWWRVATLPSGVPVGFVLPARNDYNPIIAYIGVLPEHRGNGYVDDLLAEGTRVLSEQPDVPRIRAATDLANVPMANAFRRAGYVNYERVINMTWS